MIRLSALGDLVELGQTLNVLRTHWPGAVLDLLTSPEGRALYDGTPYFREVVVYDKGSKSRNPACSFWDVVRRLRRESYDLVLDMHSKRITGYLAAFVKKKRILRVGAGPLYRTFLGKPRGGARRIDEMLRDLGEPEEKIQGSISEAGTRFDVPAAFVNEASRLLVSRGWTADCETAVFGPGSSEGWPSKRWPLGHFRELALKLGDTDIQVVLVGSAQEKELARWIGEGLSPNVIDLAGETNFQQLLGVSSLADAAVTNDSALMHFAASCATPTVTVFGPTRASRHGPDVIYGPPHVSLASGVECSPCYRRSCPLPERLCLHDISPAQVLEALRPHLASLQRG